MAGRQRKALWLIPGRPFFPASPVSTRTGRKAHFHPQFGAGESLGGRKRRRVVATRLREDFEPRTHFGPNGLASLQGEDSTNGGALCDRQKGRGGETHGFNLNIPKDCSQRGREGSMASRKVLSSSGGEEGTMTSSLEALRKGAKWEPVWGRGKPNPATSGSDSYRDL